MAFFRCLRALLLRNLIYRKRRWLASIFEFALPIAAVGILVGIKNSVEKSSNFTPELRPAKFRNVNDTLVPFSFRDYATALQAKRTCLADKYGGGYYTISGIEYFTWPVPFVKCDSRRCTYDGEDASDKYCEYNVLGVAPSDKNDMGAKSRVNSFLLYLKMEYPQLFDNPNLPFEHEFVKEFDSSDKINEYVKSGEYGTAGTPKIGAAVVIGGPPPSGSSSSGAKSYPYTVRVNSTNFNSPENEARPVSATMPNTNRNFDAFAKTAAEACQPRGGTPNMGAYAYDSCPGQYIANGAITVQRLVDDWILWDSGASSASAGAGGRGVKVATAGVRFVYFPRKEYMTQGFYGEIAQFMPLLIVLGLLYPIASCVRAIVQEKELRQKELMKMMSVSDAAIGWSWFLSLYGFLFLTGLLCTVASTSLFANSQFPLLLIFFEVAFLASLMFVFVVAACFSRGTRAVLVGLLLYFIGYFLTLAVDYQEQGGGAIFLVSLHPVTAFSYGLQVIGNLEDNGVGLTSDTTNFSDFPSGFTFNNVMGSLFFDSLLWGVLSWYLNRVVRGDYGRPYPWYFPFTARYWCPGKAQASAAAKELAANGEGEGDGVDADMNDHGIPIEPASDALKAQTNNVHIRGLTKKYGEKTAVDGLNLSMYSGQVTALLGHNGAGKTTTINMLTGMVAPTSGTATIAGLDARTQMKLIRSNIGICLQHDCLFPDLTVREHVRFFSRIKGLYEGRSTKEAEAMVNESIEDVALMEKRDTYSKNLSGGMKRKLSVAIAFCGGSKTVFLDEPTSGMDPFSRRFTWNVIRQYRQDRCIILTTHFMDEADILGDRIAIMGEGQLRCAGSSLFLKKQYGVGYQLVIEKKPDSTGKGRYVDLEDGSQILVEDLVRAIVKEAVPQSVPLSDVGTELSFQLPLEASGGFVGMFEKLDELVEGGDIVTYGVSITTLDEVFLMVARGDTGAHEHMDSVRSSGRESGGVGGSMGSPNGPNGAGAAGASGQGGPDGFIDEGAAAAMSKSHRSAAHAADYTLDGGATFSRHVRALFAKRAMNFKRDKKAWCCSTVCPSLFALFGFLIVMLIPNSRDMTSLTLTLDMNNEKVEPKAERNPIPFNQAGGTFTCQPGRCVSTPAVDEEKTGERYYYCGSEAKVDASGEPCPSGICLGSVPSCTVSQSDEVVNRIVDHGAFPVPEDVETVAASSVALLNSSRGYAATQYGALYFTRESGSEVGNAFSRDENGTSVDYNGTLSYGDSAVRACESNDGNYTSADQCDAYDGTGYIVATNYTAYHASVLYQAVADEALARYALNDDAFKITPTIHPLPITKKEESFAAGEDAFAAWFLLVLSFPFVTGAWATFVVAERKSKAKHLQTVAGVKPWAYWLSSYFWDIINYQLPLWIIVILMFAFDVEAFTDTERGVVGGTITALVLFGPAAAGFTYIFSFMFDSPSMCNLSIIVLNFLVGMAGPLVSFILRIIGGTNDELENPETYVNIARAVEWVLRFFPIFNLSKSLFYIINIDSVSGLYAKPDITVWDADVMLIETIFLIVQSFVYVAIAVQIDKLSTRPKWVQAWRNFVRFVTCKWCFDKSRRGKKSRQPHVHSEGASMSAGGHMTAGTVSAEEDEDVVAETERVLSGDANGDLIVLKDLTKVYGNGKRAVDHMSFGIPPGMCFGLLGINGAGKTTTMGMLTAEFPPSSGDAALAGYSVTSEPEQTRKRIGYCPQFDAHFMNMTGREHVELYASIKGVPKKFVKEAAAAKLAEVGLSEFDSDRLSGGYSGGMKRKLSVACATIGQPQIVFLDEPSTGMDPVARRDLWSVISNMVIGSPNQSPSDRTSVILTTHSMEECEALCPLIGIMAGGKLRCLGSAQRLKSRYGEGFQVEMKCREVDPLDDDYKWVVTSLSEKVGAGNGADDVEGGASGAAAEGAFLNLDQVLSALKSLTDDEDDDYLSSMITPENPAGYILHRSATSEAGVALSEVAAFAAEELRMKTIVDFFAETYPTSTLRERQETKVRYEVPSDNLKISGLFGTIEENKEKLRLADYGVSQTTLEQVFNMHAAKAEQAKHDTVD